MGIRAPMYYAVQEYDDAIEITYAMLYAQHGGQTCRALRLLSEFDCIVETLGMHQGDLERVVVTLIPQPGGQYGVLRVGYESHGDMTYFPTHSIAWEGTHPIVNSALNGHSSHSIKAQGDRIVDFEVPLIVSIVSALGAGLAWRPFDSGGLLQLGLDASGKPIGSQGWAAFAGRLGDQQTNQLDNATYFDGSNLSGADWAFVKLTDWVARLLGKYPENILEGNGPTGPGDRAWIKPASGKLLGDALTVLTATSDVGRGPGAVAWLSARR